MQRLKGMLRTRFICWSVGNLVNMSITHNVDARALGLKKALAVAVLNAREQDSTPFSLSL
jgi:hypothetical protein